MFEDKEKGDTIFLKDQVSGSSLPHLIFNLVDEKGILVNGNIIKGKN